MESKVHMCRYVYMHAYILIYVHRAHTHQSPSFSRVTQALATLDAEQATANEELRLGLRTVRWGVKSLHPLGLGKCAAGHAAHKLFRQPDK